MCRSAAVLVAGANGIERLDGVRFLSLHAGCHGGFRGLMTRAGSIPRMAGDGEAAVLILERLFAARLVG